MPFAVTHILFSLIAVDLYRDYVTKHKKYFTLHTVFLAGLAGLLPDIDIPLNWLLSFFGSSIGHGTLTHTPFFGLIFLIPGFILLRKNHKVATYFFVICFGVLVHITLDLVFTGGGYGIMFLYPLSTQIFQFELYRNLASPGFFAGMDAIILLAWLWHEERKHKIIDYI